jgi:predicted kinase
MTQRSALIIIGGFAGSGKTVVSKRLAYEMRLPRLEADLLGKTIRDHASFSSTSAEAYQIGYSLLWTLSEEFLRARTSVVVDANMAWEVAWESVDALRERCPGVTCVPIVLRCPREVCLERIRRRYLEEPGWHGDPERFQDEHATLLWQYLLNLSRSEVKILDSNRPLDDVHREVSEYVTACITSSTGPLP